MRRSSPCTSSQVGEGKKGTIPRGCVCGGVVALGQIQPPAVACPWPLQHSPSHSLPSHVLRSPAHSLHLCSLHDPQASRC